MNLKSTKNLFLISSIFILASCGGGDTSIVSPGELGPLSAPSDGGNDGGGTSSLLTGSCPSSPFISNDATIGGNTLCAIVGPITDDILQ